MLTLIHRTPKFDSLQRGQHPADGYGNTDTSPLAAEVCSGGNQWANRCVNCLTYKKWAMGTLQ